MKSRVVTPVTRPSAHRDRQPAVREGQVDGLARQVDGDARLEGLGVVRRQAGRRGQGHPDGVAGEETAAGVPGARGWRRRGRSPRRARAGRRRRSRPMPGRRRWSGRRPRLAAASARVRLSLDVERHELGAVVGDDPRPGAVDVEAEGRGADAGGPRPARGTGRRVDVAGDRGHPDPVVAPGQREAAGSPSTADVGGLTRPSLTVTVSPEKPRPTTAAPSSRASAEGARPGRSPPPRRRLPRSRTATAWSSTERTQTTSPSASIWDGVTGRSTESTTEPDSGST